MAVGKKGKHCFIKQVDASKVRFPTVSLCKFNGFRCGFHSGRCPDRESWSSLKDVLDNSFALKDFYEGATVAPNILDNLITDEDNETVRIDESLWERRPQDLKTTGFCHTLNLDKIMFRDLRANNVKYIQYCSSSMKKRVQRLCLFLVGLN